MNSKITGEIFLEYNSDKYTFELVNDGENFKINFVLTNDYDEKIILRDFDMTYLYSACEPDKLITGILAEMKSVTTDDKLSGSEKRELINSLTATIQEILFDTECTKGTLKEIEQEQIKNARKEAQSQNSNDTDNVPFL